MKIDVHNHAIPRRPSICSTGIPSTAVTIEGGVWRRARQLRAGAVVPRRGGKLAELESKELEAAVVSVSPTIFYYHVDAEAGEAIAVAGNEGLAAMSSERLRWMASVPLQAPERAAAVLAEAVEAGAVGVEVGTSAGETPLDDPSLEPFWAAAEKLGAPVMLHARVART